MSELVLKNVKLNEKLTDITILNGVIKSVEPTKKSGIDFKGNSAFSGLIDVHIHGGLGLDVTYDSSAVEKLSLYLAQHGITSWYPTVVAEDVKVMQNATRQKTDFYGANIPGFHIEGPYLTNSGAMRSDVCKKPDINEYGAFKNVKMITVSPDAENICDFISECEAVVSLGHTNCDYKQAQEAFAAGAKCVTHLFNVMPPFNHREPGLIGAAVTSDAFVQLICDGVHIHRSAVLAAYRIFGPERMILISDAMAPMGYKDNTVFERKDRRMIVKNGVARTEDGRLYGSASNLFDCVKKAISFGIPRCDAFKMASFTPAKLMGLNKGEIKPEVDADIIIVNDKNELVCSIVNGEIIS